MDENRMGELSTLKDAFEMRQMENQEALVEGLVTYCASDFLPKYLEVKPKEMVFWKRRDLQASAIWQIPGKASLDGKRKDELATKTLVVSSGGQVGRLRGGFLVRLIFTALIPIVTYSLMAATFTQISPTEISYLALRIIATIFYLITIGLWGTGIRLLGHGWLGVTWLDADTHWNARTTYALSGTLEWARQEEEAMKEALSQKDLYWHDAARLGDASKQGSAET